MTQDAGKGPLGLRIIGGFKVLSALLLVALAVGIFGKIKGDPGAEAEHLVAALKLDPDNYYVHAAIEKLAGISPRQLQLIEVGTYFYALLYLAEGVGLLMRKQWAEYFTVFATGSLIPLEVYEAFKRPTAARLGVLAINVAIVAYLVYQLRRRRQEGAGADAAPAVGKVT